MLEFLGNKFKITTINSLKVLNAVFSSLEWVIFKVSNYIVSVNEIMVLSVHLMKFPS